MFQCRKSDLEFALFILCWKYNLWAKFGQNTRVIIPHLAEIAQSNEKQNDKAEQNSVRVSIWSGGGDFPSQYGISNSSVKITDIL